MLITSIEKIIIYRILHIMWMQVETVQTSELPQLNKLVNEIIEQRNVIDIKFNTAVLHEKLVYTALVILDD